MKRWLVRLTLVAILAAFAVWLEPTRVVWGWLRGEAFYQGRPTSYWRREIARGLRELEWTHVRMRVEEVENLGQF